MAEVPELLRAALSDRYDLQRELGRGGMAAVYLAVDLKLRRSVAIKVLSEALAQSVGRPRFLREIEIATRLNHPHILSLLDSGEAGGLLYYVMPYVEGESLKDRLVREKQLPVPDVVAIAGDVAAGLDHAHAQGVVHRDIKPGNILLFGGSAVVADFGIARAVRRSATDDTLTDVRLAIGTPPYMSPEQWSGTRELDARSDVYSLGCVVYEMLAGDPPFSGPTTEAIAARAAFDPVPPLRTVRPRVSPALERAILTALEKVPADRFGTATAFAEALTKGATAPAETSQDEHHVEQRPTRRWTAARLAALATAVALLGIVSKRVLWPGDAGSALDRNKVVVFPLIERGFDGVDSGAGYDIALMIGAALEHTEPLKWIDGWQRLDEATRANPARLTPAVARAIARDRGARFFLDGVTWRDHDSSTVILRLYDSAGDSLIGQSSSTAPAATRRPHHLGLAVVRNLLPMLLDPGRQIDVTPLSDRSPAAVALWIQGERQYRRSRFGPALEFYLRAVAADSAMAFAAIKGAQAASWTNRPSEATQLAAVAVRLSDMLPRRYAMFAIGLDAYLKGHSDSAVTWLQQALRQDSAWSEAAMALGEVYYHLMPSAYPLDSLAANAFRIAAGIDTGFSPPLHHLAEIALRQGRVDDASAMITQLARVDPEPGWKRQLNLMLRCVRDGPSRELWQATSTEELFDVLAAGKRLSGGALRAACGESAFRAVLADSLASPSYAWGAFLGLQGLLVTQGRYAEAAGLIDSVAGTGTGQALQLYVLDGFAGMPVPSSAQVSAPPPPASVHTLYFNALGQIRRAEHDAARRTIAALDARVDEPMARTAKLFARTLAIHLGLSLGDTAGAIRRLRSLRPQAPRYVLTWDVAEPLAAEQLLLAQLLLATGDAAGSHRAARIFDHGEPVAFLPFIASSLGIRYRAALELRDRSLAARYADRLRALGREDLVVVRER